MKRFILPALAAVLPIAAFSQSAVDALQLTQPGFKGTARFMSMGGAFTALGGDLTTLSQNPAGIGIYRSNEIGLTLGLDFMNSTAKSPGYSNSESNTKFACNNFGYIGCVNLPSGALESISWGASYNRISSFNRVTSGYVYPTQTSLTNYIAAFSNGYNFSQLDFGDNYNPYYNPDNDWLSVLGYTSYFIHPLNASGGTTYDGLYIPGVTDGDAKIRVREKGYIDQYSIDFGGNFSDIVYWGVGVGIDDISYTREVNYSESMANARIWDESTGNVVTGGDAGYYLDNYKNISGSGWNVKVGAIIRPIPALRIGLAFHSPTWYNLTETYQAGTKFSYYNPAQPEGAKNPFKDGDSTELADFDWKFTSPWRAMAGIAYVIGDKGLISVDYERVAYPSMRIKTADNIGYFSPDYSEDKYVTQQIKDVTRAANTIRVGAEYRITPNLSVRAGYNYTDASTKNSARDGKQEIITAGIDPSFNFDKSTQNICAGIGYRFNAFSIDAAFVHTTRTSTLNCYTSYDDVKAPTLSVKDNNNEVVISASFRF